MGIRNPVIRRTVDRSRLSAFTMEMACVYRALRPGHMADDRSALFGVFPPKEKEYGKHIKLKMQKETSYEFILGKAYQQR